MLPAGLVGPGMSNLQTCCQLGVEVVFRPSEGNFHQVGTLPSQPPHPHHLQHCKELPHCQPREHCRKEGEVGQGEAKEQIPRFRALPGRSGPCVTKVGHCTDIGASGHRSPPKAVGATSQSTCRRAPC